MNRIMFALTETVTLGDYTFTQEGAILLGIGAALLVLMLILLGIAVKILRTLDRGGEEDPHATAAAPVAQTGGADDGAVVAAIIAAITAMRAEEGNPVPSGFRVVSFKRNTHK